MKAAVLYTPGGAENFRIEERPMPVPTQGQVLVKIKAFGLNRSELMTRKGLSPSVKFPRILGIECVGEIESDPSGEYHKGQQVAACMGEMGRAYDGSYAEYSVMPKSILYPFESTLSWQQLGAIPEMFQTAYGSLYSSLRIQEGETLLIRGGTSSVGLLAAQMATNAGLTVLATTRNPKKEDLLRANGAHYVLREDGQLKQQVQVIFPEGVDKVLELVGALTLKDSLQCLKPGGIACMTGMLSENWSVSDFAPMDFISAATYLTTYDSGQLRSSQEAFQSFIQAVEADQVNLSVSRTFRLDEIVEAHQLMENNQADGKIVVMP